MAGTIFSALKSSAHERYGAYDITAYVGRNGSGKTMMAVNDLLPTLAGVEWQCSDATHWHTKLGITSGYRNILSTAQLFNPETQEPHALCVPYTEHSRFTVAEHSDVLLDEVTAIYPSRGYGGLPNDVAVKLNQPRKPDLKVIWTAPNWNRADTILREGTEQVVTSRRFAPKVMPGRVRKTYSRFLVRSFNGDDFKNWVNSNQIPKIKPETYELYHRKDYDDNKKGWQAQHYYNSFADAFTPVASAGSGACVHCGGQKAKREQCRCSPSTIEQENLSVARQYWANQYPELLSPSTDSTALLAPRR